MDFEHKARIDLLTFLVVGQLVARECNDAWLDITQLVELLRIRKSSEGPNFDWMERVRLGIISEEVATGFASHGKHADAICPATLFTGGWQLDYHAPVVVQIQRACEQALHET